jgi:hypothetical protein
MASPEREHHCPSGVSAKKLSTECGRGCGCGGAGVGDNTRLFSSDWSVSGNVKCFAEQSMEAGVVRECLHFHRGRDRGSTEAGAERWRQRQRVPMAKCAHRQGERECE